uniref:Uncharacterized protein n=1 Tax=Coturnix japonica TaxID=93934 RepID=A0A8C2SSD6_COTJA
AFIPSPSQSEGDSWDSTQHVSNMGGKGYSAECPRKPRKCSETTLKENRASKGGCRKNRHEMRSLQKPGWMEILGSLHTEHPLWLLPWCGKYQMPGFVQTRSSPHLTTLPHPRGANSKEQMQ